MIQRIQSVWLLLAGLCGLSGLKLPFFSGTDAQGIPSSTLEATDTLQLTIPTIVFAVLAVVAIFYFKNRPTQLKLTIAALVAQALVLFFYFQQSMAYMGGNYALTCVLQFLAILFIVLAIGGIRKDDRIIKESNRLR